MKIAFLRSLLLIVALGSIGPALAQPVVIQCSDTLLGLGRQWADTYTAQHADMKIQVIGGSSVTALEALAAQKIRIATISRSIRYKEKKACEAALGQPPTEYKVGVGGVAVYVNAGNPVTELTYDEISGIYRGKLRNWRDLGGSDTPILVLGSETNTPAGELFLDEVLAGKDFAKDVRFIAQAELLKGVARETNAVGFGAFVRAAEGTRALSIKRVFSSTPVEPSEEAISNRIYPISRFLYCYLNPASNQGQIKAYLDWIRGDQGQQMVRQAGFFPLPPKLRVSQ